MEITKELLETYIEQKIPNYKIATLLNCCPNTITKYIKKFGLVNRVSSTSDVLNTIKNLYNLGKTVKEIASELSISPTTVLKYERQLQIIPNVKQKRKMTDKFVLSDEQLEIIYGSMLGDMSMSKEHDNARISISHGGNQEVYFDHKCQKFSNILGKISKTKRFDKRTNKWYNKYYVRSLSNQCFNSLYDLFYIDGIKTVTLNWLDKLTPKSLAYWFMDDGTNNGALATNCFGLEEIKLMQSWFLNTYNLKLTIQKSRNQYLLYFHKKSKKIFYQLTHCYFTKDMLYKVSNWNR